jgi:hypothetical protein
MVGQFTVVGTAIPPIPAGTTAGGTAPADTTAGGESPAGSQISSLPVGGVQAGGGSTVGFSRSGLIAALGGGLLMLAFISAPLTRRVVRQR